jgi:hypothetical protein
MSGGELAQQFHADVVAPLLARAMPRLRYAAGRLGSGSDMLGLDDAMSHDHDWGCRLTLLVDGPDREAVPQVSGLLPPLLGTWPGGICASAMLRDQVDRLFTELAYQAPCCDAERLVVQRAR